MEQIVLSVSVRYFTEATMKKLIAQDIMKADVLSIHTDWTLEELADFLNEHSITGGPVVDDAGTLVGVVSTTDIVRNSTFTFRNVQGKKTTDYYRDDIDPAYFNQLIPSLSMKKGKDVTVRDIMTPMTFSVSKDTRIQQVADAMIRGRIHRVMVTDEDKLLGIITTMDLLDIIRNQ
jgi:CBS domain-containing protein